MNFKNIISYGLSTIVSISFFSFHNIKAMDMIMPPNVISKARELFEFCNCYANCNHEGDSYNLQDMHTKKIYNLCKKCADKKVFDILAKDLNKKNFIKSIDKDDMVQCPKCKNKKYLYEIGFCPYCNEALFCKKCHEELRNYINNSKQKNNRKLDEVYGELQWCPSCKKLIAICINNSSYSSIKNTNFADLFRFNLSKTNFAKRTGFDSFHNFIIQLFKNSKSWDGKHYQFIEYYPYILIWGREIF